MRGNDQSLEQEFLEFLLFWGCQGKEGETNLGRGSFETHGRPLGSALGRLGASASVFDCMAKYYEKFILF